MHQNTDFCDYVFVGKTSIVLKDLPLSHWRLKSKYPNGVQIPLKYREKVNIWGKYPNGVQIPLKYREKVNIWGGLSTKGLTRFCVSFLLPVLNRACSKIKSAQWRFSFKKS